ncbi:flagellar motor switch protein FliN [Trinickia terrae]|uniref:Flagellar motor switch protein FliN n=2 Tax=Trinickia terrae TaxID=2571161 RepID=A0A4U1I8M1_9BURK|nr:flagellar motor switch protein FliN [Trinickia terrae]
MRVDLPEQTPSEQDHDNPPAQRSLDLVSDVKVTLDIRLGSTEMTIKDLMALQNGAVVKLDRHIGESIDVQLNQRTIARAEIVAIDEQFGIRITEILADR